jgi:hypothetical protein
MKRTFITFLLVALCIGLCAQWSTNAFSPNQIYGLTNSQVIPKTAVTANGLTWIAWMDNTTGNYNTYLQKLSLAGTPEWTNPILVSDNATDTWLTEWDMDCDPEGNAILCFQDVRYGTNNVVIYKISPTGTFLWGEDGIMLSNDNTTDIGNMSPTVICLQDGRTIAAWQRFSTNTTIALQSMAPNGTLQWGDSGIILSPATGSYTWPQMVASDDCCIILKYFEDTGPFWSPTRKILAQKFDQTGQPQWMNPVYIQSIGGLSAWNQWLSLSPDGIGGMIICWHEDRNAENISYTYIQRVLVNGTVTMPADGVRVSQEQGFHQFYPKLAFEPVGNEAYVFWNRVNGNQNMWGLHMQKMSLAGDRLWGETGTAFVPIDMFPTYPISAMNMQNGVVFLYAISPVESNDLVANIKAFCVGQDGTAMWNGGLGHIAVTQTQKLHYDSGVFDDLWGVVTWEDGGGPSNIYAMRFNYNGSLGMMEPTPYNLTAEMVSENELLLSWQYPDLMIMPIGYKIYRNGVFYHQVNGASTMQYLITDLGPGLWSFYVTALNENGTESPPSNEVTVNLVGLPAEDTAPAMLSLNIYPNPFSSAANLSLKGIKATETVSVSIYNVKGQMIRQVSVNGSGEFVWNWDGRDQSRIPVSPGVYLVKVSSGQNRTSAKLMKF